MRTGRICNTEQLNTNRASKHYCHCVKALHIGYLLLVADAFAEGGSPYRSVSTIATSAATDFDQYRRSFKQLSQLHCIIVIGNLPNIKLAKHYNYTFRQRYCPPNIPTIQYVRFIFYTDVQNCRLKTFVPPSSYRYRCLVHNISVICK